MFNICESIAKDGSGLCHFADFILIEAFGKIGKAELNHWKWNLNPSDGAVSFLVVCVQQSDAEQTLCFVAAVILHLYLAHNTWK